MQQVWRNRWEALGWFALGAITLVVLVAAAGKKVSHTCRNIEISFQDDESSLFVDEKSVKSQLKEFGDLTERKIEEIDLESLEKRLERGKWIANAELFFDNQQTLQVVVEERQPVARIFTATGSSFYIDSACIRLPLSEKYSARLPMFTNFPSNREKLSKPDSLLMANAKDLAVALGKDDFWRAQVAQVDITSYGFEMVPTLGSHLILLGFDGDWKNKLDRLYSFYKQVWTKVGFEKYEKLDVRFESQVVATVKGARSVTVDTLAAREAYQQVLAEVKKTPEQAIPELLDKGKPRNERPESKGSESLIGAGQVPKAVLKKRGA